VKVALAFSFDRIDTWAFRQLGKRLLNDSVPAIRHGGFV